MSFQGLSIAIETVEIVKELVEIGLNEICNTFPILLPRTCFSIKLNLDRYKVYLACLLFNFYIFIKYLRFL